MPTAASKPDRRRLLTLADAAGELSISIDTIVRYVDAGALPVVRLPSGRRRIAREDLDAAIRQWKADARA